MKNKKYILIALFGPSGSGKLDLLNTLLKNSNFNKIIMTTTNFNEKNEKVISIYEFTNKILEGEIIEATCDNNYFYGIEKQYLKNKKINITILNIEGIECLLEDKDIILIPIYIVAEPKVRLERLLKKANNSNCEEICRKFLTENQYFNNQNFDFDFKTFYNGKNIKKEEFKRYIENLIKNV